MCQATVFLDGDKILEDVIEVRSTDQGVELSTLFERLRGPTEHPHSHDH
jgi:predicted RNA-binding protein